MAKKHSRRWPGGEVRGVPLFNPENVARVEEGNREVRRVFVDTHDDLPDAAFFAMADEMGLDFDDYE